MDGAIGSTGSNLSQAFPVVELLCFLVLILITVFRRKLSSNDQYRSESDSAPPSDLLNNSNVAHFFASVFNGKSVESTPSRLRLSNDGALCLERISLDDNILLNIVVYLSDSEIEKLTLTSKKFSENCTSDFIWEQLWIMSFGAMWNDPNLVKIREMRGITWNSIDQSQAITRSIDNHGERSSLHVKKCPRPPQGWFIFYKEFEFCWMDWLLAGCCTQGYCLIGLYGSLYDITNFLPDHPVSFYHYLTIYL